MRNIAKNWVRLVFFLGILLIGCNIFLGSNNSLKEIKERKISYSDFLTEVNRGDIKTIYVQGQDLYGKEKDNEVFEKSYGPFSSQMASEASAKGTQVNYLAEKQPSELRSWIFTLLPLLIPIAFFIGMHFLQGRALRKIAMPGSRSKMRWISKDENKVTFKDVAGADEAKEELKEVVDFLKEPTKYELLGGKIPKGVLMVGPPGTGKTLLAKAVAGEAHVPFATIAGSEFIELFVGMGASRVREMFTEARKKAPCIIFIDEIDSIGKKRNESSFSGAGNDEREQTLNQILVEMDGFASQEGIIIIAATNRADVLDNALLRPGRFDRQVTVPNPDVKGREAILKVHLADRPLANDVCINTLARGTPGFSGADLANVVNEAALMASKAGKKNIDMYSLEQAKDKVMMGPERRSMVMSEKDRKATAYHEAGHAICGLLKPEGDPLHKVTIIPRGQALGLTFSLPIEDKLAYTIEYLEARLIMTMGGRAAEDIIYGARKVSNGASGDIQQATQLATAMVTQWGMSEKIGMIGYNLGDYSNSTSEHTKREIESEIKRFIDKAYQEAKTLLTQNKDMLEKLTLELLDKESLDGADVRKLLNI